MTQATTLKSAGMLICLLATGCEPWQYPWRTDPQAAQPLLAASPAKRPAPPSARHDSHGDVARHDDPKQHELEDMLARLQHAQDAEPMKSPAAKTEEPVPNAARNPQDDASATEPIVHIDNQPVEKQHPRSAEPAKPAPAAAPRPPAILAVHVIDREPPKESEPTDSTELVANSAIAAKSPVARDVLADAIAEARKQLAQDPANIEKQWRVSLLELAASRPDEAARISAGLDPLPTEILSRAVGAAAATGQLLTDPMGSPDDTLAAIDRLRDRLKDDAQLQVPVAVLCSRVEAFGVYQELPPQALSSPGSHQVIVYCEIRNFVSTETDSGKYRTLLANRIELFTSDGKLLFSKQEDQIEDICRRPREDFFLAQLWMD